MTAATPWPPNNGSLEGTQEKGRPVSRTAFPYPTAAPHWRAISGSQRRGPISQPHPDRQPLHIGAVANCCPNRRDGPPSP